jgi:hypothetical protein
MHGLRELDLSFEVRCILLAHGWHILTHYAIALVQAFLINFNIPCGAGEEFRHLAGVKLSPSTAPPSKRTQQALPELPQLASASLGASLRSPQPGSAPAPSSHRSSTAVNALVHKVPDTPTAETALQEMGSAGARAVLGQQGSTHILHVVMSSARTAKRILFPEQLESAAEAAKVEAAA